MATPEEEAAAAAAKAEKEKKEGEMPQWAKDLKAQVEALAGGGGAQKEVQKIPETKAPLTDEQKKEAESKESKSGSKKGFLDWLM